MGENVYILKNPTTDILRDPSIAFDSGGFTKTAHEITEENGLETRRKTKIWGWVTTSVDTHSVIDKDTEIATDQNYSKPVAISKYHRVIFTPYKSFNFISSAWQQVSETITTRKYNEEGYLIEQKTTGKKLFRLKQDNSSLEGINTQLSALDLLKEAEEKQEPEKSQLENRANALLKLAQSYRFTETEPIKKTITYELQPLSKYFSDISKPWDKCDWVEPRFAHHTLTTEAKRLVKDNPGSTEDFPLPPITVGKEFKEEQKITITSRKKPGRFVTTRFLLNAEGEGLDQKLKLTSSGESIGRPSIHQRKENINNNPPPSFAATGGSSAFLGQRQLSDRNKQYKYLLNSEGSNSRGDIPNGSISFPDVYDVRVAQDAAFTKLSIDNTKQAEILTIKTLYKPNYQEGDRLIFDGKEYVILRINFTIDIAGINKLKCDDYQLTLGRLLKPKVTVRKIKNNPKSSLSTGRVTGLYAIDGNVTQLKSIYNYLSPNAIANAVALGLLDEFVERTGLRVVGQEEFNEIDGIDNFLSGGLSGSSANGSLGGSTFAGIEGEREITDLRIKTPIENFADLINRLGLLSEFNDQLDTLLGNKLIDKGNSLASAFSSSGVGGGGGGDLSLSGESPSHKCKMNLS